MSGSFFKKALAAVAVLVLALTLGIVVFNGLMGWLLHSHEEVAVPSVVGKSVGDALDILSRSGLTLSQESVEYDESVPAGAVLRRSEFFEQQVPRRRLLLQIGQAFPVNLQSAFAHAPLLALARPAVGQDVDFAVLRQKLHAQLWPDVVPRQLRQG